MDAVRDSHLNPVSACRVDVPRCVELDPIRGAGVNVCEHPAVGERVGLGIDVVGVAAEAGVNLCQWSEE